ncbi:LuxR C-terminal-related transcriptional regulator, partial [Acinetobacter baumannii]
LVLMSSAGQTDQEIAKALGLSKDTVNSYWKRILPKMGAASRTAAVATYWRTTSQADDSFGILTLGRESSHGTASIPYTSLADCFT